MPLDLIRTKVNIVIDNSGKPLTRTGFGASRNGVIMAFFFSSFLSEGLAVIYLSVEAEDMDTNACNFDNLPPRKRLLAGFKRQNSDLTSPSLSKSDIPLKNPFMAQFTDPNLSIEEIVEASRIAAIEAAKVAEAAKAKAEEKAAKAAKAFAAAKSALDLVATLSDEAAEKESCLRKNKMKKHVSVEELYSEKNKGTISCGTDEELARNLHRSINSSPRISKNSDVKIHKHKKLKSKGSNFSGSKSNGLLGNLESEGPSKEIDKVMVDLNMSKPDKSDQLKVDSIDGLGRKRGKIKQKKLPLSICSFMDQIAPEEELNNNNGTLFSSNSNITPVEKASLWKCQSVKAPACLKQNKVMRS
ncbi:P450 reductase 1 [Striga asiatica]|uniref:P450 reductase 1 n=1 Tax=Striga asiatica TaxID=4170 RepID=A0A5A7NXP8_STRAF|nr:P450 reductase 1 [Striga asiatica]